MQDPAVVPPDERFNFARHLFERNAMRSGKVAYLDDDPDGRGGLTYAGLEQRARRVASALRASGARREDRVLLLMHDCNDWPVSFLGALYAGVVPVAINTMLTAADYAYVIANSRSQLVIVSSALKPCLDEALEQAEHEVTRVVVSHPAEGSGDDDFESWLAAHEPMAKAADTGADDVAFWLYSSGSTGRPKGTVHAHGSLYWTAELYAKPVLGLTEDDVCFSAAKLFFAYGLGNALTFPLSVGATVVLMAERPTPDACFRRMKSYRPTVFFGAPTGFAGMLASPALPGRDEVALRMCSSAGEALPRDIGERFTSHFGCHIIDGIGSTEMLHIFLSNRPGDVRYGTTGKPVAGYEVELRDEADRVIEGPDQVGDLYIKGPSSALMYWSNRQKSRETFQGMWTKSGDKYLRDADGYYIYAGRSDDMLKVSGQYVSPFEVESTLMEHPAVLEAAVIGVPDEHGLTRTRAYVVPKSGHAGSVEFADELKAFVKSRLAPVKYPREIEFVAELPKTATGKIQRFKLRERSRVQAT
jgi:benzoate-CoA ligase